MQPIDRLVLTAAFGVFLVVSDDVAAQTAVQYPPVSANAALQYWQAFATMPTFNTDQEELLRNWSTAKFDEATIKLLDESQTSLKFLYRASQMRECDWGLDYRDGAQMYLPHLIRAKMLARIAALDARRALENKDYDRAHDDVVGMLTMARYVGKDYTLVSMLVSFAIEEMAVELAAPYLPDVRAAYDKFLEEYLALPPRPPLVQGVLCEKRMAYTVLNQLAEAEHRRPGSWRETWKSLIGEETSDPFEGVVEFGEVLNRMEEFLSTYDELAELTALPPAEYDSKYPEFANRVNATNPVASSFLPAIEKTVAAYRRSEARLDMMLAAIAVVDGGPEELADIKDPFGDGPFEYRKLDRGFQLSSKLVYDGKQVTLEVGRRNAEK